MTDKNGIELKTGMIVKIEGGYFKADNGFFVIKHTPGDPSWLGNDYSLHKCNKDGKESETKGSVAFWPLMVTVNSREKAIAARAHNKEYATIEVVGEVKTYKLKVKQTWGWSNVHEFEEIATESRYQELLSNKYTEIEILDEEKPVEEIAKQEIEAIEVEKIEETEKELIIHELNKDLINRANYNSFAGKRGDISKSSYMSYAEKIKSWDISTEKKQLLLDTLYKKWSVILKYESQHVSVMVAGPAKYNSKKLDKGDKILQLSAEFCDWFKKVEYRVEHPNKVIKSSDSEAVQKLTEKLEKALKEHESYKEYNIKARKEGKQQLAPYVLQNSNQRIKTIKERLAKLEKEKATEVKEESFGDIKIIDNTEISRIQIIFPDKPDADMRTKLKQNGFKWAPSNGAWQNFRNKYNLDKAKAIIGA